MSELSYQWKYNMGSILSHLFYYGFWGILAVLTIKLGGINVVINDISLFYSGGVATIAATKTPPSLWFPIICTIALVGPSASILIYRLVNFGSWLLSSKDEEVIEIEQELSERVRRPFFSIIVAPLQEELLFRWFLLGVLPMIPFLSGSTTFYFLLATGNIIWALLHFANYKRSGPRGVEMLCGQLLALLPHFVVGLFLSYEFVKLGIVACVLSHALINGVNYICRSLCSRY